MRRVSAFLPLVLAGAFGVLWWIPATRNLAWRISDENHVVELATFVAFFLGGLLGLDLVRRLRDAPSRVRIFLFLFALGMLLIAMEEISWGQWFFGFDTPDSIRWRNRQGETNLHNLGPMYGKSSFLRLAFAFGGVLGFVLRRHRLVREIDTPRALLPWLAVIGVLGAIEAALDLGLVPQSGNAALLFQHAMPEMTELLTALAALGYVWIHRRRLGAASPAPFAKLA